MMKLKNTKMWFTNIFFLRINFRGRLGIIQYLECLLKNYNFQWPLIFTSQGKHLIVVANST